MAIETTIEPRLKWWTIAYLAICLALGLWGLYDYTIRLPNNQRNFERFQELSREFAAFQTADELGTLPDADRARWAEVDAALVELSPDGRVPQEPAKWDRWVKFWLYVVACGIVGVPWFAWTLISVSRRRYRLEDDGTLVHPDGRWSADEIVGIDMGRWMEKSIATVRHRDGSTVMLDAYKYRNLELIIGEIAHRFEPHLWQRDGRMVKPTTDGSEADAAVAQEDDGPLQDLTEVAADDAGPADPSRT